MTPSPSFKERLREILKQWKSEPNKSWDSQGEHDYLEIRISEILMLVKEMLPEYEYNPNHLVAEEGFFECRKQFLKNLEGEK